MENKPEQANLGVDRKYQISSELWEKMKSLLPPPKQKKKDGRPRMDDRKAMNAIVYVLRTGCQWNAIPKSLGASSTVHDRFQEWMIDSVFERFWKAGLMKYDEMEGIDWEWQAMDGAMTKAPLGGKRNRSQSYRSG
jgi:putative transposase